MALDFQTLLNMNDGGKAALTVGLSSTNLAKQENRESSSPATTVAPDADRVQELASLLNVDLGSSPKDNGTAPTDAAASASASNQWKNTLEANLKDHNPSANDIRAKYAAKLKGGLAGIELAKSEVGETLTPGDAAGHLAARKMAIMDGAMNGNNNSSGNNNNNNNVANRWLPSQAAAQLLTLLTHRSIRIVLLPTLETKNKTTTVEGESETMKNFKDQLPNVVIDKIISKFDDGDDNVEGALTSGIVDEFELDPTKVLLVSKSDPYLKAARDMGMNICRLRPKNARLGSITPHYTVQTIGEVQDVVNEINGISFNTVLNR